MGAKPGTINGKVTQGQRPGMEEKEKQENAGQYSNLQVGVKANLKGQPVVKKHYTNKRRPHLDPG